MSSELTSPRFLPLGPQRLSLRAGDRLPGLIMQILNDRGDPVSLVNAVVFLSMRRVSGEPGWSGWDWTPARQVLIVQPTNGVIYYDVQPFDTDTNPGEFELALRVEFADGISFTAPTKSNARVYVRDKVEWTVTEAFLRMPNDDILTDQDDNPLIISPADAVPFGEYVGAQPASSLMG